MDLTDVRVVWDRNADAWEQKQGDEGDVFRRQLVNPLLHSWLARTNPQSVLDACCGNGYFFNLLRQHDPEVAVDGLDLSPAQVQYAQRRLPRGQVIVADLANSKTPGLLGHAYDCLVCTFALDGIEDLSATLARCHECLVTRGHFIYTIPHPCFYTAAYYAGIRKTGSGQQEHSDPETEDAWDYTSETEYDCKLHSILDRVPYYHRPIDTYLRKTRQAGFDILDFVEPTPTPEVREYVRTRKGDEIDERERKKRELPAYTITVVCRKTSTR